MTRECVLRELRRWKFGVACVPGHGQISRGRQRAVDGRDKDAAHGNFLSICLSRVDQIIRVP